MKPKKLYIKIFLSFVLILIITEIFIFGLFIVSAGRSMRSRLERHTSAKVLMVKELLEEKVRSAKGTNLSENQDLKEFISRVGEIYEAKVWLADSDETPLLKSFTGDIPADILSTSGKEAKDFGDIRLYHDFRKHWEFYATIPLKIRDGEIFSIHVLFERGGRHPHGGRFALGLLVIGIIIALLIIPVSRFITERVKKLRQSALRIAEGDLSHRVTVKGKDEIGELALAFNRMTDKLERMIISSKELTANVSHELRTPLTRIRIAEELLREKIGQGDLKELERHLDDIREDIEELDSLMSRILELSKMDIHEAPLKIETLNPTDLMNQLLERLKPVIERKDLRVKTSLSFHPPFKGDRDALYTALLNILDNAAKFTFENGDIIVKMQSEQDSLAISVTNSFEKMAEEDLARIFDPFHRAGRSREAGSGLGLAITKKIIERHGGEIEAVNSPEGLEIRIRLPAE